MPKISDVTPYIQQMVNTIKQMPGVNAVYATGSFVTQETKPEYHIKDLDIVVNTDFDSGDLLAIDIGPNGPFNIPPNELEDFGFNPKAVKFTKAYTALRDCNIDHWAASNDGKVLHWGRIPESIEEWQEIHEDAEKYAASITGYNRMKLTKTGEDSRHQWHEAYTHSVNRAIGRRKKQLGWYASDHPASEILASAKLLS